MNITKKAFSIFFLLFALNIFPNNRYNQKSLWEKALYSISTSYPIYWYENNVATQLQALLPSIFGNKPATPHYQKLGKEAQIALGIPEAYHVPIKQLASDNPLANFVAGIALPDGIYVNEGKLNEQPYGVQRCAIYHEAAHKKYNDNSMDDLIGLVSLLGGGYGAYKILKSFMPYLTKGKLIIGSGAFSLIATMIACSKHSYYYEKRADIEGFYATECATCVQEMMTHRHQRFEVDNHPLKHNGYLHAHEIEPIAQDLRQQNKICAYHGNHS